MTTYFVSPRLDDPNRYEVITSLDGGRTYTVATSRKELAEQCAEGANRVADRCDRTGEPRFILLPD